MTVLLLATLSLLVTIIVVELEADARSPDRSARNAGPAPTVDSASLESHSSPLPPLASLSETTRRPLFLESRRAAEGDATPVEPVPESSGPGPTFSISAVLMTEDERAVLVNHPTRGELVRLREGEAIAGWILEEVAPDRAVFTKEGESQSVTLRSFGPPPAGLKAPRPTGRDALAPSINEAELRRLRRATRRESEPPVIHRGE